MSLNSPFLELCLHRALVSFQPLCRALSSSPSSCEAHEPSCTHPSLSLALAHSQRKLNFWRRVSTVVIMQDVKTDPWQLRSFPYASQQPAGLIAEELVQGKFEKPCGAKESVSLLCMLRIKVLSSAAGSSSSTPCSDCTAPRTAQASAEMTAEARLERLLSPSNSQRSSVRFFRGISATTVALLVRGVSVDWHAKSAAGQPFVGH